MSIFSFDIWNKCVQTLNILFKHTPNKSSNQRNIIVKWSPIFFHSCVIEQDELFIHTCLIMHCSNPRMSLTTLYRMGRDERTGERKREMSLDRDLILSICYDHKRNMSQMMCPLAFYMLSQTQILMSRKYSMSGTLSDTTSDSLRQNHAVFLFVSLSSLCMHGPTCSSS